MDAEARRRLEEADFANEELSALVAVTDEAISTLELAQLLDTLLKRLVRVMGADAGALMLVEEGALIVRSTIGFDSRNAIRVRIPLGEGFGGRIAASGRPRYVADAQKSPDLWGTFLKEHGIVSMLGVPLKHGTEVIGVLHVDWRTPHPELARELRLLQTAATRCAAAIVNARLYEESLKAGERLSLAMDAGELAVWDWDLSTGTLTWQGHQARVFGFASEKLGASQRIRELIDPEDLDGLRRAIGQAIEKRAAQSYEFRVTSPDGEERWIAVRGRCTFAEDGRPQRMTGVAQDVTARRRADAEREALLSSEKEARRASEEAERRVVHVLERVTDAFVALDTSWCYSYVSRKAAEFFGRTPQQLLGRHIWTEFPEGVGQPFQRAYEQAMKDQRPIQLEEYYPPYGRWFENRIYPSPEGLSIFFSDITEKKRTDERLRATNEQLRALTAKLSRAREEEALRISREIHDELGQLLTALNLDAGWLKSRLARLEAPERDALAKRASGMAELAQKTIVTVQRISEELRPGVLDQLGLEAALSQLVGQTSERAGLEATLDSALGDERLDPAVETGVFRMAQELLTNVARHAGARRVRVELAVEGSVLNLRVADDGRGVTPEELTAARSLGLAGLRERALLLGGSAVLTGAPGRGTEALVTIPLEAPP
jgi:PAS domain S-box-containing protein